MFENMMGRLEIEQTQPPEGNIKYSDKMGIKIHYKKLIVYGEKYRKILKIEMLDKSNLPEQYLDGYSSCFLINGDADISTKNGWFRISVGDVYCEESYQNIVSILKKCSVILHIINELNKWKGKGVDEI